MGEEHYLSKIERNAYVLDKVPLDKREKFQHNLIWARELAKRLELLDYDERDKAIMKIHEVMDADYVAMGFSLPEKESKQK